MKIEEHFVCISRMKETDGYFNRWQSIRDVYKPKLDVDLFEENAQYTPHDYERHCINIYNILSEIIPIEAYEVLNAEELFLLNVAVILHDSAMVLYLNESKMRDEHSKMAYDYVKTEVDSRINSFLSELISTAEAEFISEIILGHSDLKIDGETKLKSLELLTRSPKKGILGNRIDTRLLSALLRLADELDINSERVKFKNHVKPRIGEQSQPHWRKCEIFALPNLDDKKKYQINLRLRESVIKNDGNFENDILLAKEVYKKIKTELKYLNEEVFDDSNITWWQIHSLKIFTEDKQISDALNRKSVNTKEATLPTKEGSPELKEQNTEQENLKSENELLIQPINSKFSKRIENWVIENELFTSGHYHLSSEMCARDWINTTKLLSTHKYINQITTEFKKHVNSIISSEKKYLIIGEGFPGVVLSSTLGYKMQLPFTYVIPQKDFSYHTREEKDIIIPEESEIILITDAIIYGNSIQSIIDWLKEKHSIAEDRIISVLSVFYRKPSAVHEKEENKKYIHSNIASKMICLDNSFPVEICTKTGCIFKERNLITHEFEN